MLSIVLADDLVSSTCLYHLWTNDLSRMMILSYKVAKTQDHSYSPTHGPSRTLSQRVSPKILDPAQFSAGAAQTQGWPYDPTRNSMTTAIPNGQYQSTMQSRYSYPLQAAESTYYTQAIESSHSYQNYNANSNNTQLYQQTGVQYHSAATEWPQQSYYDPSVQTSLGLGSAHHRAAAAAAAASTSSSQLAGSANPASSETRTKASMPTASTSRPRKGVIPDMKSKMNRFRATNMASTIPVTDPLTYQPKPSAAGEKRKERSPTPDSIRAGAPPEKEAKKKEAGRARAQNARDKLNSDIAKLAGKLPSHLLESENMSSKENIVQAAKLIDEQRAEINRLTDDNAQLKASRDTYQQQAIRLGAENWELQMENQALSYEKSQQQYIINENERRIRELERAQTW